MATLQVRNTLDLTALSGFRERAREDASRMQAKVDEDCARTGKPPPDYRLLELIGKGSFGRVYKAVTTTGPDPIGPVSASGRQQPQQPPQQQLVAVKIIDIEQSDSELSHARADTYGDLLKEIHALRMLRATGARNINLVIEALPVGQSVWMVTEYCAGGSVATLMKPTMPGGLQERWIIPIVREVAEAVSWVHRQGIIHRDIKCANVLVTESGAVQLCDFGVSGVIETKLDKRSTVIGTPHWMAPELLLADGGAGPSPYGTEVDIWAFGAMVFEIASGHPPNVRAGLDLARLCAFLRQNAPRLEGDEFSPALRSLVAYCLQSDPARRPTIEDVQRHGYIAVPGTTERYPTSSLALLVHGYKAWEAQGGSRRSLFLAGGAQGPPPPRASSLDHYHHHHDATAAGGDGGDDDDWNFSTTAAFDQNVLRTSDAQVVYDVYGSGVELELGPAAAPGEDQTPAELTVRPAPIRGGASTSASNTAAAAAAAAAAGGKARRRPPPQLPVLKAPLEKIFDPSTMSSYSENSRVYYGRAPPPPPQQQQQPPPPPHPRTHATVIGSDLPLRDDSTQPGQVRESLIDLDASLHGSDLSRFVDMETIKGPRNGQNGNTAAANNSRTTTTNRNTAGHHPDHHDLNHPPLSDPADTMANNNRRTQDWKFPSMAPPPASAHPEMFRFPFHGSEDGNDGPAAAAAAAAAGRSATPPIRPGIIHHPTEPVTSRPYFGDIDTRRPQPTPIPTPTGAATPVDNRASVGSLIDLDMSLDLTRPSTSHSDFGSMTGSELGSSMGPFELDLASTPAPAAVAATGTGKGTGERQPSLYISAPREPSIYVDANPREPSIYVDDSRHREPSLYADRSREPSIYADSRREPSIYADHNREPSIYVESSREPSIYVESTREPSIYVESNREPSIYVDSNREPSIYVDSDSAAATREPSVHVPDNSDLARSLAELAISRRAGAGPANNASGTASGSGSFSSAYDVDAQSYTSNNTDYAADQAEYLTMSQPADLRGQAQLQPQQLPQQQLNQGQSGYILGQYQPRQSSASASLQQQQHRHSHRRPRGGPMLPPAPAPPSQAVMQGQASPEDVREELRRMAMSLGEHLAHANAFMDSLPVKRAGGGGSSDQPDGI